MCTSLNTELSTLFSEEYSNELRVLLKKLQNTCNSLQNNHCHGNSYQSNHSHGDTPYLAYMHMCITVIRLTYISKRRTPSG